MDFTAVEAGSLRSRSPQVGYSRGLSPGCVGGCLLPVSSHGRPSVCACILISSYKDMGQNELEPNLMTSFYLNYLLKALSPNAVTL